MNQGAPRSITLLPPRAAAARSTIMYKAAMAVTGLIMVLYLLAHMYGNLKVFAGKNAFDNYAHHLRELGEPILPHTGALWIIRVVLLASVLIHIYAAFKLWYRSNRAAARHGGRR
jgi:succinate dehydrogenase / fumarate reductase, cytochrome b subunit